MKNPFITRIMIILNNVTAINSPRSVIGRVPSEYRSMGSMVSASFQKQTGTDYTLIVMILKEGKLVASSSTDAAYGIAAMASPIE